MYKLYVPLHVTIICVLEMERAAKEGNIDKLNEVRLFTTHIHLQCILVQCPCKPSFIRVVCFSSCTNGSYKKCYLNLLVFLPTIKLSLHNYILYTHV